MAESDSSNNAIYNLITSLCEKFATPRKSVKKLRSTVYEILLNKRAEKDSQVSKGHSPYCNLLIWQYTLASQHGLGEYGVEMMEYVDYAREVYGDEVLQFLWCLRDVPRVQEDSFEELNIGFQNLFKKPTQATVESIEITNKEPSNPSIWELVVKEKYSDKRNWENFGHAEPEKEKPFLSELGSGSRLWAENLSSVYAECATGASIKPVTKSVSEFVADLKFLLVGMASYSFNYNQTEGFSLFPKMTVDSLTPSTIRNFSQEFIECGNFCKALQEMSTPNQVTGEFKKSGYIFAELCQSIQRYLQFHRTIIMHLPENLGLIQLDAATKKLRVQLVTLSSICKVGTHQLEKIPHGVSLINYLYQTVFEMLDRSMQMVVCGMLFPCCQVYFSRFLQPWLLNGIVNDPHGEFFIKPNCKYIGTRGRTFWTRSYSLREDIIPDFLVNLKNEILSCGRAMNLLKFCMPSNKLCRYLMGQKPFIISCCFTHEQLTTVTQNSAMYELEVISECGPGINFERLVKEKKEQDPVFMNLIAKKRAITLQRIELERKKAHEERHEKKQDEISTLREQYDSAVQMKQARIAAEINNEIKQLEFTVSLESMRDQMIEKEAIVMIDYYNELCEISEKRKKMVEKHIETLKKSTIDDQLESRSSQESFYSVDEEPLDVINANGIDNFTETEMAREIKRKVLEEELGIIISEPTKPTIRTSAQGNNLSEAQRNKLKVLSSEFGIDVKSKIVPKRPLLQWEINRNRVLGSDVLTYEKNDNDNFVNKNVAEVKTSCLSLDLPKIEQPSPMSVDSTPMSDSSKFSAEKTEVESIPATAETATTDEGFNFEVRDTSSAYIQPNRSFSNNQKKVFSKRVSVEEAKNMSVSCLNIVVHEGIFIPLRTQTRLVNNEILKYYIDDLKYLQHLESLRDYFFLQDGEFARNITENLFEKLYDAKFPIDLINHPTLRKFVFDALQRSNKFQENSKNLSFKMNNLPARLDLGDPEVLGCLSLTYKVEWPLNILLPVDTIAKYDEVFKYLLKLNRVSWALKKISLDLKIFAKTTGMKEIYLMMSPHYRRIHQCRHVMLHFVQTLQNYIVGEVLQSTWETFEQNLTTVTDLDSLYQVHTAYIKQILFLCLLNQKSAPLRKVFHNIFMVIFKFYNHLRSRSWNCEEGVYVHPNFAKLENIFSNFGEFVLYLFKVGRKVVKSGYQPYLAQLLDMLDVNDYYSKKNCKVAA